MTATFGLACIGFGLCGAYSLKIGVISLDLGGKHRSGAACGLVDAAGYLGAVLIMKWFQLPEEHGKHGSPGHGAAPGSTNAGNNKNRHQTVIGSTGNSGNGSNDTGFTQLFFVNFCICITLIISGCVYAAMSAPEDEGSNITSVAGDADDELNDANVGGDNGLGDNTAAAVDERIDRGARGPAIRKYGRQHYEQV